MAVTRNKGQAVEAGRSVVVSDGGVPVTMRMVRTGFPIRRCRRVDIHLLSRREQQALRDLMDGLEAEGTVCRTPGQVIRVLLGRFADAQEAGGSVGGGGK
jgi:hypothetical protein